MSRIRWNNRSRRHFNPEINIVPLLDVILVLLLIFLATAPEKNQGLNVDLPTSQSNLEIKQKNPPVIIKIYKEGCYGIVFGKYHKEKLSFEEMQSEILRYWKKDSKKTFLIGSAKSVSYEKVIKALDILQRVGVNSIGLMTKPI